MKQTNERRLTWQIIILVALLIALMGPWNYDLLNVPAQYDCAGLSFRLEGDFCGSPMSGLTIFIMTLVVKMGMPFRSFWYFWRLFAIFIFLPIVTVPFLLLSEDRSRRWALVAIWGLAAVGSSGYWLLVSSTRGLPPIQLWGLWGYVILASTALILEIAALVHEKRPFPLK